MRLRALGIYGGAQGIWVDKLHTANSETGPDGVTVGILHTGRHYEDDLSEDGVIYHYPKTSRPSARDAAEVQATKNAMKDHQLPVFVVLPGKASKSSTVIEASTTLLWQIYSRCVLAQICFRQCGHRCGGGRAMSATMA